MEKVMFRKVLVLWVGAGFASLLHGCYSENCWETATCPPMPEEGAPTCDPAEGGLHEECPGVFVSSTLGNDENIGTRDQPVRSLAKAIDAARTGPRRIYACAEVFEESVLIPAGVEIWGGLDCAAGWGYVGESAKTTILGAPNEFPVRFVAGAGRASLADVHVQAGHATTPGGSSIAVLIGADAAVDIQRSVIIAGNGARGADGTSGGAQRAADGAAGSPGGAACSTMTVQGGAGAINSCRGYDSVGGLGGWGGLMEGGDGTTGMLEPYPNPSGTGRGGSGGTTSSLCQDGAEGALGAYGAHGLGARGSGTPREEGWEGLPGQDGTDGRPGQGGGGGGGSRAGSMFCGSTLGGASGGGGGAGGCGGAGGKGGGAGGASIGVVTLSRDVTILATSITTGRGGDGGNGGLGQLGGIGGAFGPGGAGFNNSPDGCWGGDGGNGGNGGNGGGGLGGASIGIVFPEPLAPLQNAVIRTGEPGKGGRGGDPNVPGSAGEEGLRGDVVGIPP